MDHPDGNAPMQLEMQVWSSGASEEVLSGQSMGLGSHQRVADMIRREQGGRAWKELRTGPQGSLYAVYSISQVLTVLLTIDRQTQPQ